MYFWKDPESRKKYTKRVAIAFQECEDRAEEAFRVAQVRLESAAARAYGKLVRHDDGVGGTIPVVTMPARRDE